MEQPLRIRFACRMERAPRIRFACRMERAPRIRFVVEWKRDGGSEMELRFLNISSLLRYEYREAKGTG